METLKWQAFKERLQAGPELILQFQYAENRFVDATYHITEIKQATITSVDCGGTMNAWTEIIVQLWEPQDEQQNRAMPVNKALAIINLVEKTLPLNPNGIVKIEFGNSGFDTRQMFPGEITVQNDELIIDLRPDTVQCKAIENGGSCGTTANGEECCTPAPAAKPKVELKNLAVAATCAPGSNCC